MASRGVVVAGGLGPIAGKAFRLGHMGNIGPPRWSRSLARDRGRASRTLGVAVTPGAAVAAAAPHL